MLDTTLLKSLFEDDAMVRKYLAAFRDDVPISMSEFKSNIENQHWENASIIAHSIKSQLQYLNEEKASATAYYLEKICDAKTPPELTEVKKKVRTLESSLQNIFEKINSYL